MRERDTGPREGSFAHGRARECSSLDQPPEIRGSSGDARLRGELADTPGSLVRSSGADLSLARRDERQMGMRRREDAGRAGLAHAPWKSGQRRWIPLPSYLYENLLPLPGEGIFAGPSPVQSTRVLLLFMWNLIRFASFLQDQLCCACS